MKKIFTLVSFLAITQFLFGQADERSRSWNYDKSRLSISISNSFPVKVLVDGSNYSVRGREDFIMVNGIRPGYHNIKVYRQKNDRYGNGKGFGRGMQLIYDGNIYVRPQYHVDICINRFGKAFVDEKRMDRDYDEYLSEKGFDDGWGTEHVSQMDNREFGQFLATLKNEPFDNTRLVLAKQAIAAHQFSSAQVKELMQLFPFENNKLEIAKYCYPYTQDKKNYYLLNDAFAFSSSREELAHYIQGYN